MMRNRIKQSPPRTCGSLPLRQQRGAFTVGKPMIRVSLGRGSPQWAAGSVPGDEAFGCSAGPELQEFGAGLGWLLPTHQRVTSAFCHPRRALSRLCQLAAVPFTLLLQGCPRHGLMAGDITYADLRFARSPPEKNQGEEPNEGELTYENLQVPWGLEKEVAVCGPLQNTPELPWWSTSCHCWSPVTNRPMLGALVICLFLLATNIALGVQYLQATQQLQQASEDHAARNHVLGDRIYVLKASLEDSRHLLLLIEEELNSTKKKLHSTLVALWQSQVAENRTQRQLQHQELQLGQANRSLALLQSERVSLEVNLSRATSCPQIGCCPPGWTLFRWRCLWMSSEKKNWKDSKRACELMSSRLVVLPKPWTARELWEVVGNQRFYETFWVGLWNAMETDWIWKWVDGSRYKGISTAVSPPNLSGTHGRPVCSLLS
ncbi:B-cell differentiation antigen CD72 isoform X2 [Crotalus tigris]|uniref:B-cell differentiation antigen CD72 isoform X2 n=1 Tax=Crotalus tigris TaxID=88082 RepID=UPI00192F51DD|nr:B-cell differentiation antigen CD72 isoform X2 [Crotalus tigris]